MITGRLEGIELVDAEMKALGKKMGLDVSGVVDLAAEKAQGLAVSNVQPWGKQKKNVLTKQKRAIAGDLRNIFKPVRTPNGREQIQSIAAAKSWHEQNRTKRNRRTPKLAKIRKKSIALPLFMRYQEIRFRRALAAKSSMAKGSKVIKKQPKFLREGPGKGGRRHSPREGSTYYWEFSSDESHIKSNGVFGTNGVVTVYSKIKNQTRRAMIGSLVKAGKLSTDYLNKGKKIPLKGGWRAGKKAAKRFIR